LERISMDVGKVVVISHSPLVQAAIPNTYHVTRTEDGARVERVFRMADAA
jgi:DNA repair exonuclease SbcCD ATPase subunit